ncbi:MAG: hypothetical protein NUV45_13920 [Tepidanaerobacteraceae bacterium]|nr:hypothetical protein [Tepidanaerobacteraceae bacterium]
MKLIRNPRRNLLSVKDPVIRSIEKIRFKMWFCAIADSLICSALLWAWYIFILAAASHLVAITYFLQKVKAGAAAFAFAGICAGALRRPGMKAAALAGDATGLQDRLSAYLECIGKSGHVLEAFREEVLEAVGKFNPARKYRAAICWKRLWHCLLILMISAGILLIPSPRMEQAAQMQSVREDLKAEAENLKELAERIEKTSDDENRDSAAQPDQKLSRLLYDLAEKMEKSSSFEQAVYDVSQVQKKLGLHEYGGDANGAKGLAGIFDGAGNDFDEGKQLLEQGDAEGAARVVENKAPSRQAQQKVLENIDKIQGRIKLQEGGDAERLLEKIKTAAEKGELDGKLLASFLKQFTRPASGASQKSYAEKVETKLQSLKERLLAKAGSGFEGYGEQNKSSAFAEGGNTEGMKNGEPGTQDVSSVASGGEGMMASDSREAVGGSAVSGEAVDGRQGQMGKVQKEAASLLPDAGEVYSEEVKGQWQSGGTIQEKKSDRTIEIKGEFTNTKTLYRQFLAEGMEYVDKYEFPAEERPLVLEYFSKLNGGL